MMMRGLSIFVNFASCMSTLHKIILVAFVLLWLGLSFIMIDRAGLTLYNLLVVLLAGAMIIVPLVKKWRKQ